MYALFTVGVLLQSGIVFHFATLVQTWGWGSLSTILPATTLVAGCLILTQLLFGYQSEGQKRAEHVKKSKIL
jgi:ATP/ADP translocase